MLRTRELQAASRGSARFLYDFAVAQSRNSDLYARFGAPDTVEGRFELLTAHVIIVILRLRAEPKGAGDLAQRLFDLYLRNLDGALREMGVGDLAVGKRMKQLGRLFYGRAKAYDLAFGSADSDLEDLVARTILSTQKGASAQALATYLRHEREALERATLDSLCQEGAR